MSYYVVIYDYSQMSRDHALSDLAISTEERIKEDGDYPVVYADGDGFLTYVTFPDSESMAVFKLRYITYDLKPNLYMVSCGHLSNDHIPTRLRQEWIVCDDMPGKIDDYYQLMLSNVGTDMVLIPYFVADTFMEENIMKLIKQYNGKVVIKKTGEISFVYNIYMTPEKMTLFKLSI